MHGRQRANWRTDLGLPAAQERATRGYPDAVSNLLGIVSMATALAITATAQTKPDPVFMANGIKIGEATSVSALVWVRLTKQNAANVAGVKFADAKPKEPQLPEGKTLADMAGAVVGAAGEVRVRYSIQEGTQDPSTTGWQAVTAATDFAHTFRLEQLTPGNTYQLFVEGRATADAPITCAKVGMFRTAPMPNENVTASFCVVTGQDYPRRDDKLLGHIIYREMLKLAPDFLVHTGDTLYYDKPKPFANTVALARFKWNRFYGLQLPRVFHRQVPTWFIKDDHDTLKNDCWPGQRYGELTFARGLEIYREQVPVSSPPYRRIRWGQHVEVWFLEGREFRSSNRDPDGPDKTILGAKQLQWLRETVQASTATFRIVVSATPIVGPDRKSKRDNHANQNYQREGDELRAFLASQPRTIVICGDRHWQYVSHDPVTGLREWSCGPTSNKHSGGFRVRDRSEMHDYLKICGGFLHVSVQVEKQPASLVLRHYDPRGKLNHEDILPGR